MRSGRGYLARLAAAGCPEGNAALRPPRSLFAPGGGPALAGTGDEARLPDRPEARPPDRPEARPPHRPEARPPHSPEARPPHRPEAPPPHRPEARPPHSPEAHPANRHRRPVNGAGRPDVGPVILPQPARRAGATPASDSRLTMVPPPRPDRAQPRPATGQKSAATAERASRPALGSGPSEQPGRPTSATPAVTASPGRGPAAPPAPAGFAAQLSRWAPGPGKSARGDGPVAAQPLGPGRSAGPAQDPSDGRPHRAPAPVARPDPIADLVPSPGPRSAPDGTFRAPASGLLADPVPHDGGPARVTIGTIEVTVVPPPPPATSEPTLTPSRQRPSADAARRGARRCFGTGQI